MKTHFNNPDYAKKQALLQQQMLAVSPPAIPFKRKAKKNNEEVKDKFQSIEVPLDPEDKDSDTSEWKVAVFEAETPIEFVTVMEIVWFPRWLQVKVLSTGSLIWTGLEILQSPHSDSGALPSR